MSRVLLLFATGAFLVLVAASTLTVVNGCGIGPGRLSERRRARERLARLAGYIADQRTPDGWFDRAAASQLAGDTDPWGHSVRVRYERDRSGWGEYLYVESAGPDGVWDTDDDVRATVVLVNEAERKRRTGH